MTPSEEQAHRDADSDGHKSGSANSSDNANGSGTQAARDGRSRDEHRADKPGTLVIIGGHEDKEGERAILSEVARRISGGKIVVTTVASHQPEGYFEPYDRAFHELGVREVALLEIRERGDAMSERAMETLDGAGGLFFTGGDQLKITSQVGDSPVYHRLLEIYQAGGVIAGTSAGASAMCETMLISGTSEETFRIGGRLNMGPGLGLIRDVIIDQHFAERGRMGRLLGAVAQNPRLLGIGIDENTAIIVEQSGGEDEPAGFRVLGDGAVYIVDGREVSASNVAEGRRDTTLSLCDVRLHVLSAGDRFDLRARRPLSTTLSEAVPPRSEEPASPSRETAGSGATK